MVDEISARISAAALRNRGYVRTSGRGATWRATITSTGTEYLAQVDGPDPPVPRQANVSVTQQLIDDIKAAGGSLRVPRKRWNDTNGTDYARRAQLAQSHGRVPAGSRLVVKSVSAEELLIELVSDEQAVDVCRRDSSATTAPITVPSRLGNHHPLAREFRNRTSLHEVSRNALPRVLRIIHALAHEAEKRGYEVACVKVDEDRYGRSEWSPARDGQLVVTIRGHPLPVRIWEKGCGQRGPYEQLLKQWKDDREQPLRFMRFVERPKPYDSGATGQLNAQALGSSYGRQSSWGDRSRWTLEDRLADLLRELEVQAAEAEERQRAREREEAERRRQWEAAVADAKRRFLEDHRLELLRRRVREWEEGEAIRAYCDAVEARYGSDAVEADPDAAQWLALAREQANRAQQLPRMPAEPEITAEALKPYLGRWSPYGPHRY